MVPYYRVLGGGCRLSDLVGMFPGLVTGRWTSGEWLRFLQWRDAYVLGRPVYVGGVLMPFGDIALEVPVGVFFPRVETEWLALMLCWLGEEVGVPRLLVDGCTGSGALALQFQYRFRGVEVVGVDWSEEAVRCACRNAVRLGLGAVFVRDRCPGGRSSWGWVRKRGVWWLVANPPYVLPDEVGVVGVTVRWYDPVDAWRLSGGLDLVYNLVEWAVVNGAGLLLVELSGRIARRVWRDCTGWWGGKVGEYVFCIVPDMRNIPRYLLGINVGVYCEEEVLDALSRFFSGRGVVFANLFGEKEVVQEREGEGCVRQGS